MKTMEKGRTDSRFAQNPIFCKKIKKLLISDEKCYIINEYADGIYLPLITKGVIV